MEQSLRDSFKKAVLAQDLKTLKVLLDLEGIGTVLTDLENVLEEAIREGYVEVVELLAHEGRINFPISRQLAMEDAKKRFRFMAVCRAIEAQDAKTVINFMEDFSFTPTDFKSFVWLAEKKGYSKIVEVLLLRRKPRFVV